MASPQDRLIVTRIRALIEEQTAVQVDLIARTGPKVQDGHSDGRRVKYVRAEQTIATLQAVLALIDGTVQS